MKNSRLDQARLLVRVAGELEGPGLESDRKALLSWADELLAGESTEGPEGDRKADNCSSQKGIVPPLAVFAIYKHKRYDAQLLPGWRAQWNGTTYRSPSSAAIAVCGHSVNGWLFWRFLDPEGEEVFIDVLRQQAH